MQGNYQGVAPFLVSPLDGLSKYTTATYVEGCNVDCTSTSGIPGEEGPSWRVIDSSGLLSLLSLLLCMCMHVLVHMCRWLDVAAAVAAAQSADATVIVVGIDGVSTPRSPGLSRRS